MTRIETLSIICDDSRILLGMKKKGFGKGKYNGFGGGLKENETERQCAIREVWEEAGIKIINPQILGKILFEFDSNEQDHLVYFFKVRQYKGEIKKTKEMIPRWFYIKDIPYNKMWAADKYWLPLLLKDKRFRGNILFDREYTLKRATLKEIK